MTFLTFGTADILNRHAVHFTVFQILMEFLINAVEFIAIPRGIGEIDLAGPVTIDTPAHTQLCKLLHLIHLLDRAVTGLALYLARADMLRVAEKDMVGEIMDLDPFYRFTGLGILARFGIITRIAV